MITFKSLEGISFEQLCLTLNNAFSQYFVKIDFTPEMLKIKCNEEDFNPSLSVGAFDGEELVGVILHGYRVINGQKTVYNMATGVVLTHRGQQLTKRMYQYIIPILKENDITNMRLEVIQANGRALKVYEAIGFHIHCSYDCFKQKENSNLRQDIEENKTISILPVKTINHSPDSYRDIQEFYDVQPSWSNQLIAIEKNPPDVLINCGAYMDNQLVGFASFNPKRGRVKLLAIHPNHRKSGIGQALLNYMANKSTAPLNMINIDDKGTTTIQFLKKNNFELTVRQYEMRMKI